MKKELDLKFYSENELDGLSIFKSIAYAGKYENHIRAANQHDLTPEVFNYIRDSYKLLWLNLQFSLDNSWFRTFLFTNKTKDKLNVTE